MIVLLMIAIFVLWILYIAVLPSNINLDNAVALLFEKCFPFVIGAFYLGELVAEKGFSYIYLVFLGDEVVEKSTVVVLGIGIILIFIVEYFLRKRVDYCIRDILTLAVSFIFGYTIIKIILLLMEIIPFPLNLIFAFLPIAQSFIIIVYAFSILLWFIPNGTIAALNNDRKERERRARNNPKSSQDDHDDINIIETSEKTPNYVTDDDGNVYSVEMRGDYLVIFGPRGELSTRWEYIRGQDYFDLGGYRFFLH